MPASHAHPPPDPFTPLPVIDRYLSDYVRAQGLPAALTDAILYSLLAPGKRLRPILAWHACVATGGEGADALAAAGALELVHAFSLVHDDLPALDDDDLRRGRPTLHLHTNEATAILAGDGMLALAFKLLTTCAPYGVASELAEELATAAMCMIAGQVYDSLGGLDPGAPALERVRVIHSNKTGALIRAACRMGVRIPFAMRRVTAEHACDPDPVYAGLTGAQTLDAITAYADALGLMFQVVDDLLDVEMTHEQTGKRTRKDAGAGKLTYPGLIGVEGSRREVQRLMEAALAAINDLGPAAEPLRELCRRMAVRRS
jgi:geranylgeranyl diphosphate synthase type II